MRNRRQQALTLSEVILVMGLAAIVVVAMLTLFSQGLRAMTQAQQLEEANSLARELMERLPDRRSRDGVFDGSLPTGQSFGFPPAPYPGRGDLRLRVTGTSLDSRLRRLQVEVVSGGRSLLRVEKVVLK